MRTLLTLAISGILALPAAASPTHIQVGGKDRIYTVHVPPQASPAQGFPVVLVFHGGGQQGAAIEKLTQFDSLADQRGFIVVYPDGVAKHWNDGRATIKDPQDDVGFVAAMLDQLGQQQRIDTRRIYATGVSNGALFAERLGCDLAPRIAGIAPVAGTMPADLQDSCKPARPVAVMQVSGTADPIMPFTGGAVADFGGRGEGGNVLSFADTGTLWARRNGCGVAGAPRMLAPIAPLDRTRAVESAYTGCPAAGAVKLVTITGGGHTWPGGPQYAPRLLVGVASRQLDASAAIADFFLALPPR
jgi:polyhydroxybutyrate depolymerase